MSVLAGKYKKLKTMVGGNREKTKYEETFGMPQEELHNITMPNAYIRRVLSQTEFAIRLSEHMGGKYDKEVEQAIDFMQEEMDRDGVLTKTTCESGEKFLLPISKAAKEYKLILAAHAHIDMNWMWGWHETVAATIATFRTMLNLMDEYPDFRFSQSQASVYKIVEEYAPEMKPEIEKRIREGRWEVTASAWVETDKNMPSTESLLQHMYYTKKYLQESWGVSPESLNIDFSPDTFGHSANLPELDALGGVKYYYHCRGLDGDNALYRWRAPSGKEMIVYREQYWYNSGITPLPAIGLIDVSKRSGGLKTGIAVYGVGDHGGGPTRRDLERALEMKEWPVFPQICFGTFGEFFTEAESVREKLPLIGRELNFIMPGCYTTQSRIKMANRHCEAAMFDAQLWDSLASCLNFSKSDEKQFERAWQNILFTHFHDILTGSCVQESREHAMGKFSEAMAAAHSRSSLAMQNIASNIDTSAIEIKEKSGTLSEGAGAGFGVENYSGVPSPERGKGTVRIYHLFNAASIERKQACEITVWDWTGDICEIKVEDDSGREMEYQLIDDELQHYWSHTFFRISVFAEVPAFGYSTVILSEKEPEEYRIYMQSSKRTKKPFENIVLENELLRAEFDYHNGDIISLVDKTTGDERVNERGGLRFIQTERATSNAWNIGRYEKISGPLNTYMVKPFSGDLISGAEILSRVGKSEIKTVISLEKGMAALKLDFTVDWHETSGKDEAVPVLAYRIPLQKAERYLYDVPGGAQYRNGMDEDVPGLQYGAAVCGKRAVTIISDSKYGYRGHDNTIACTLINSTYSPDPYPERGIHHIKLYTAICNNDPKEIHETAFLYNHQVACQSGSVQKGKLALKAGFIKADLETAVISGISTEKGYLTIRLYETAGKESSVNLEFPFFVTESARMCDIMGMEYGDDILKGGKLGLKLKKNQTVMIRVKVSK